MRRIALPLALALVPLGLLAAAPTAAAEVCLRDDGTYFNGPSFWTPGFHYDGMDQPGKTLTVPVPAVGPVQPDGPVVVVIPGFTTPPVHVEREYVKPIPDGQYGDYEVCVPFT